MQDQGCDRRDEVERKFSAALAFAGDGRANRKAKALCPPRTLPRSSLRSTMPVARTTAAAASVVRTFARAARPQPGPSLKLPCLAHPPSICAGRLHAFCAGLDPAPAACCAPAIASTSRALATSTRAAAESPSSPLPPAPRSAAASSSPAPAFSSRYPPGSGTHLYAPSPEAQRAYLASLLDAVGVPNPHLLDEYVAEKTLTHKSGVDKVAAYGRKMKRSEVQAIEREQAQERRAGHNEKFAFIGADALSLLSRTGGRFPREELTFNTGNSQADDCSACT